MKKEYILYLIVGLLSLLFMYAAIAKAMDYGFFVSEMSKSPLLMKYDKQWLAPGVLGVEFLIVALLSFTGTRQSGLFLSFFVMLLFTLYLSTLYFFYTNIPCSCGGILGKMSYPTHIIFNAVFTLLAAAGVMLYKTNNAK